MEAKNHSTARRSAATPQNTINDRRIVIRVSPDGMATIRVQGAGFRVLYETHADELVDAFEMYRAKLYAEATPVSRR